MSWLSEFEAKVWDNGTFEKGIKYRLSNVPSNVSVLLSSDQNAYGVTCTINEDAANNIDMLHNHAKPRLSLIWASLSVYQNSKIALYHHWVAWKKIFFFRSEMMTAISCLEADRTRTCDPQIVQYWNLMLYQLSYSPVEPMNACEDVQYSNILT